MVKRFVSIWFPHLTTDWFSCRQPHLRSLPFVLRTPVHGRMIITATNAVAEMKGVQSKMALADARAIIPDLHVLDDSAELASKLLKHIAEWCIRFTPVVAVNLPDGILLDATGCPHLWGGDEAYVADIKKKLNARGYDVRVAIADTIGVAWGVARFCKESFVIRSDKHIETLMRLPPEALRLEDHTVERLHKLGLHQIRQFVQIPRQAMRRRFGQHFIMRLSMALGEQPEALTPVQPIEHYQERLPCLEPVVTAGGIEMALRQLLQTLCFRLQQEQKGLRSAIFKGYRVDARVEQIDIGTNRPSHNVHHLFKLFESKIPTIAPALGIELFVLEAPKVEDHLPQQQAMWDESGGLGDVRLAELIDRLANKVGAQTVQRYLPDEHYWPERSFRLASSLQEKPLTTWCANRLRPAQLLPVPERIEVTALIPDYPPMLFRYKGKVHQIARADGPERIEQAWWLQQGQHRDYYCVEDEDGSRYWIFRLGHYHDKNYQWFLHGFFA